MGQRSALIAGATGLIGSSCLRGLLGCLEYEHVIAVVRRPSLPKHPRLIERVIDFDKLSTLEISRVDDVFCALGTTIKKAGSQPAFRKVDLEYPAALAAWAVANGARQFLTVSSVGANASSSNFYLRVKGEMEAAVVAQPFSSVHIFRPSILIGARPEQRFAETMGIKAAQLFEFALVGLRKYRPIEARTVAAAMLVAAKMAEPGVHVYHYDEIKHLSRG
jgi:uncharacterized protein YbjT (DUF2867 family)